MRAGESSSGLWLRRVCLAGLETCSGRSLGAGPSVGFGEGVRRDAREREHVFVGPGGVYGWDGVYHVLRGRDEMGCVLVLG